jgi:1-acyl-sn-glycerol-3-phosphate acyltransferase
MATLIGIPVQWLALRLKLPLRRRVPMYYHRLCLKLLDVRVEVRGAPARERPLLFVANHCSWLDILVFSAVTPLVFIAKHEIGRWPLVGLLAKLQRTVFVDRSRRRATGNVNREIAARMADGDPVVLFGEGTSSDGNTVLPFRSALFGAVRDALGGAERGWVQPVSIAYTRLHGLPMGRQFRPWAAWYGDVSLTRHFWRVLRDGAIDVVVTFGPAVAVDAAADRKALARSTHDAVRRMTAAALAGKTGVSGTAVSLAGETR